MPIMVPIVALLLAFSIAIVSPAQAPTAEPALCASPTSDWQTGTPEAIGLDSALLLDGEARIPDELPFLRSLLIVRHRCLVYEQYFGGADETTMFNGFSTTKSVTGALIGIAIASGEIESVTDSIGRYLDLPDGDPHRRITVSHLLRMLSGIDWDETSAADIGGMLAAQRDEVGYILGLPLTHVPGGYWNYSTADSHLLSAVLTAAVSDSTANYARSHLFDPLGIADFDWNTDSAGINFGGTQLFWRAQDMARFGQLILQQGEWDGQQIVSDAWIAFLTRPQLADPSIYELSYAAHWWHVRLGDWPPMSAASGYGGQLIIVAPEQDAVIVTTANSYVRQPDVYISGAQEARQREAILDYIEQVVLPALASA